MHGKRIRMQYLINGFRGFCKTLADSVPMDLFTFDIIWFIIGCIIIYGLEKIKKVLEKNIQ